MTITDYRDLEAVEVAELAEGNPVNPPDRPTTFADVVYRAATADRKPIIPAWLRSSQGRRGTLRAAVNVAAYALGTHLWHSPRYAAKVAWYAPKGMWKAVSGAFLFVTGGRDNWQAMNAHIHAEDYAAWQQAARFRVKASSRRMWKAGMLATPVAVPVAAVALLGAMPRVGWYVLTAALVLLAAKHGRPADRPILERVTVGQPYRKLTAEIWRSALLASGYGKEPGDFQFPVEITRDANGSGYQAVVDLPAGVTAAMMMDRRQQIAGSPALRMPLDQVWMREGKHSGQLVSYVADTPLSQAPQPAWPLLKAGRADIFKPLPFATDERGNPLSGLLMFVSVLIGAIPRMGKTFVLRLLILAASLDPRVEIWAADLKGTGDLRMFQRIAARYFVGDEDDEIEALLEALRGLQVEMRRRAKVLRSLPPDLVPESKVTPDLAGNRSLGLHPIVVGIDECQVMFKHKEHGKEFAEVCEDLAKRGPALGIIQMLATQKPDRESLPTGISGNVGARICLKVMGHQANDMILGQSMHANGYRATDFRMTDRGLGIVTGFFDTPMTVRINYVDAPAAERVVDRAMKLREQAGTLPTQRQPEPTRVKAYNLLADVRAVWVPGETALWSELIVPRLADLRPDVYGSWDVKTFGAAMKAAGVPTVSIHRKLEDGKGATRYGVKLDALTAALPADERPAIED